MQGLVNGMGGIKIKSIQFVSVGAVAGTQTYNITINAVDMSKTMLIRTPYVPSGQTSDRKYILSARLTSATNIEAVCGAGTTSRGITIVVVEFAGNVNVQRGASTTPGAVAIASVDPAKSFSTVSAYYVGSTSYSNNDTPSGNVTGTTTLSINGAGWPPSNTTYHWEVITIT